MPNLTVNYNKTLKLTNVIVLEIPFGMVKDGNILTEQMNNYIKSKGLQPIGPFIQYTSTLEGKTDKMDVTIRYLQQTTGFICKTESPYKMESILRVPNCMYVRYCGQAEKLKFAYDKLMLTAFEENISLKGDNYTVYIDGVDDQVTVDIFMEKAS